jgi:signal transduction histidine kinase
VLYREPSLWEEHPRLVLATDAILVLQSLLIVGLLVQHPRWKRAEESLRDSEERMSLAAEAANLGMWVWDIARDDIWSSEQLNFQRFIDRVHPEDREPTRETALRLLQTRGEFDTEYRLLLPDRGVRWIATRGHGTFDNRNRAVRLLGVSIDITARKLAHLQLQRQRDELAHLSRVTTLGELATTLAHELNQPLGAIHSNAEAAEILLQKNPPDLEELRAIFTTSVRMIGVQGKSFAECARCLRGTSSRGSGSKSRT